MRTVRGIVAALMVALSTAALAQPAGGRGKPAPDSGTVHTYAGKWSIALPAGWTWHDEVTLPYAANGEAAARSMREGDALPPGAAAIGFFPQDELDEIGLAYTASPEALFAAFAKIAGGGVTAEPLDGTGGRFALTAPYPFSPVPPPATAQLVVYAVDGAAFAFVVIAHDFAPFADVARGIVTSTVVLGPIP